MSAAGSRNHAADMMMIAALAAGVAVVRARAGMAIRKATLKRRGAAGNIAKMIVADALAVAAMMTARLARAHRANTMTVAAAARA